MQPIIAVFNQRWLKAVTIVAAPGFTLATAAAAWEAARSVPNGNWLSWLLSLLVVGGLAWFTLLIFRLLAFVNVKVEASRHSVAFHRPSGTAEVSWNDLSPRIRTRLQMIEIRDKTGKLLFAADWWATGARELVRLIREAPTSDP